MLIKKRESRFASTWFHCTKSLQTELVFALNKNMCILNLTRSTFTMLKYFTKSKGKMLTSSTPSTSFNVHRLHAQWFSSGSEQIRPMKITSVPSRREGLWWAYSPKYSSKPPPNSNMKHYKFVDFFANLNVKPPCTNVKPSQCRIKLARGP